MVEDLLRIKKGLGWLPQHSINRKIEDRLTKLWLLVKMNKLKLSTVVWHLNVHNLFGELFGTKWYHLS